MHVGVDLGFGSLVVAVVAVVLGFVIRGKWRRSVARKAEVRRLLVLAAEEAARAEHEATLSYYGSLDEAASSYSYTSSDSSSSSRNGYQCAVCFCPTTTRCARCKAVRYCSGKCQIIHWRQGHKEECQPFSEDFLNRENEGNHGIKVSLQEEQEVSDKRYENAPVDTTSVQSISSSSTEVPYVKNEFNADDCSADEESTYTASESGGSFSGFSTSPLHSGSSDDVSVVESAASNETEGSDGRMLPDAGPDMLENRFNNVGNSHPSSPKFACLVDYLDSDNEPSISNHSKHPSSSGSKIKHAVAGSSHQNRGPVSENSATKHNDSSSGFWGRTLDSVTNSAASVDGSASSYSNGDDVTQKSHSESVLYSKSEPFADGHFVKEPELVSKGISVGSNVSGALDANEATDRSTLSKKSDNRNARSSSSVSCEKPTPAVNGRNGGHPDLSQSGEHKSEPSLVDVHLSSDNKDGSLSFDPSEVCPSASTSTRTSFEIHDAVSTSKISKTRISSTAAGSRLAPKEQPPVGVKSERQDNGLSDSTITPSGIATPSYVGGLKSSILKVVDQFRGPKSGRYNTGLFSYDMFVKLYISNKVEMGPFGLVNCGNSCYANAVLQCLAFTPPLTAYFAQGLHSKTCVHKGWCFSCEFEKLILKGKESRYPLSPIGIISQLRNIGSQLSNGREEDAHEFLRYSIDTMQSICLKEAGASSLTSLEEETTLVSLTFGGYLHSKIRCLKCNYKSERQERMMDLAVEIGGEIAKLEDALRRFTSSEILDGDNKYLCSRCKSKEKAKKKLTILEAPNVLTIALKRFQSGKFGKLNKSIRFPEILNLAPYMSGTSDKSPIYGLYGVIVHLDVMNAAFSGHYVCYVKNVQNKWFKVDDSTVTSVDLERVLAKGAYMLLYSRCSPRAPRLIRNLITSPDAKSRSNQSSSFNAKSPILRSRSNVTNPNPQGTKESLSSHDSFYLKFHRLQKILEEDNSSDSFSFSSNNSDEGSCSTDSAKGSACTDELSDYIFGGYNTTWRSSSDSDASSSSSSPMYSTYSPTSTLDGYVTSPSQPRRSKMDPIDSTVGDGDGRDRPKNGSRPAVGLEGKEIDPFLHPDSIRPSRKLVNSSSCRETDSVKVGSVNPCSDVKSGLSSRRSTSGRASQWL